jgi:tetratricopeptide (TPR) repeat protein
VRASFRFCCLLLLAGCSSAAPLPPKAVELNRTGVAALQAGDLETADARFSLALEYNPRFVDALVNLGVLEIKRGNFERARSVLKRARRLNPDVAQPHHALGTLAEHQARPDEAARFYREALAVDPGFAESRLNLGRVLFAAGQFDEARIQFKRLVEVAPNEPLGHAGLAESLLRLGRSDEADSVVDSAHRRFPNHAPLSILAARAALRRGDFGAARQLLLPLSAGRNDVAVQALGWLAASELARGRPHDALRAAHRALSLDPHEPVATYVVARALTLLDDPGASAWRRRALLLAPSAELPAAR